MSEETTTPNEGAIEKALERAGELDWLDGEFSDIASIAGNENIVVTALLGWIGLNIARRSIVCLAELQGNVDVEKDLLPHLSQGRPVIVTPELMRKACAVAANLAIAQAGIPPMREPKLIQ
jgi:hypothetical protein